LRDDAEARSRTRRAHCPSRGRCSGACATNIGKAGANVLSSTPAWTISFG
jgi:hypothetical protein